MKHFMSMNEFQDCGENDQTAEVRGDSPFMMKSKSLCVIKNLGSDSKADETEIAKHSSLSLSIKEKKEDVFGEQEMNRKREYVDDNDTTLKDSTASPSSSSSSSSSTKSSSTLFTSSSVDIPTPKPRIFAPSHVKARDSHSSLDSIFSHTSLASTALSPEEEKEALKFLETGSKLRNVVTVASSITPNDTKLSEEESGERKGKKNELNKADSKKCVIL